MFKDEDTIAAISTAVGEGGIAIVRLSGPRALEIADKAFIARDGKGMSERRTYTTHYGHIAGPDKKIIDEVIITVMRAPKSYTKEDVVEINCHGGIQAAKNVLELLIGLDARVAEPGEFTKRAFLNGRIDLVQAEAVLDMISAKTEAARSAAMSQLEGGLSEEINEIRGELINIASAIEASIDFPDEGLDMIKDEKEAEEAKRVSARLAALISGFARGMVLREGVSAVICGKPNVGKSSLMNLLLKRDRVIVTPVPGTTRDAVEETIDLNGIPIRLVDTAGITEGADIVEKEGVKKSARYLGTADIALLVLDGSRALDDEDIGIARMIGPKRKLVIINKCDMPKRIDLNKVRGIFKDDKLIEISVKAKDNIASLEDAIADTILSGSFVQGEPALVTNARHKELLDKTLANMISVNKGLAQARPPELIAIDLKEAIYNLGLIVGKSVSDDILDRIFERFCIGK